MLFLALLPLLARDSHLMLGQVWPLRVKACSLSRTRYSGCRRVSGPSGPRCACSPTVTALAVRLLAGRSALVCVAWDFCLFLCL